MTENLIETRRRHCSIYKSDFDTSGNDFGYHDLSAVVSRIFTDWRFDDDCRKIVHLEKGKRKMTKYNNMGRLMDFDLTGYGYDDYHVYCSYVYNKQVEDTILPCI